MRDQRGFVNIPLNSYVHGMNTGNNEAPKQRAERQAETRQRIVEALVALHRQIGPAPHHDQRRSPSARGESGAVYSPLRDERQCSRPAQRTLATGPGPCPRDLGEHRGARRAPARRCSASTISVACQEDMWANVSATRARPVVAATMAPLEAFLDSLRDGLANRVNTSAPARLAAAIGRAALDLALARPRRGPRRPSHAEPWSTSWGAAQPVPTAFRGAEATQSPTNNTAMSVGSSPAPSAVNEQPSFSAVHSCTARAERRRCPACGLRRAPAVASATSVGATYGTARRATAATRPSPGEVLSSAPPRREQRAGRHARPCHRPSTTTATAIEPRPRAPSLGERPGLREHQRGAGHAAHRAAEQHPATAHAARPESPPRPRPPAARRPRAAPAPAVHAVHPPPPAGTSA